MGMASSKNVSKKEWPQIKKRSWSFKIKFVSAVTSLIFFYEMTLTYNTGCSRKG